MDKSILMGPWGGNGGDEWDDGVHNGVREINLVYGSCIDSIRVTYDNNGKPFLAEKHGGIGGSKSAQIKLQFPEEILVSVSGHSCRVIYGGHPVIRSLTFKTNKRTYGPFGVEEGTPFNFMTNGGRIVGFYGRSGWFLDSLGICLSSPKPSLCQRIMMMFKWIKLQFPDEILISVSGHYCPVVYGGSPVIRSLTFKTDKRIFGPFGVEEGTPFNFLTNGGQIVGFVGRSGWFLDSLGFCLSNPKPSLFRRFQIMFKGFNPLAIKDGEDNKTKGSKGYRWGI
ncbi:hypothetical protein L1987_45280 [Smallanthus sonchifolius]|uniref:Uncharacterized protein n=1 Tax=Smallanthus sonchifolius TaxID=185202 RepID=A0ACB9GRM1_9ASTR|nr:hypothetical protein L1987_45280 [Smallanthus sonchifolius]